MITALAIVLRIIYGTLVYSPETMQVILIIDQLLEANIKYWKKGRAVKQEAILGRQVHYVFKMSSEIPQEKTIKVVPEAKSNR